MAYFDTTSPCFTTACSAFQEACSKFSFTYMPPLIGLLLRWTLPCWCSHTTPCSPILYGKCRTDTIDSINKWLLRAVKRQRNTPPAHHNTHIVVVCKWRRTLPALWHTRNTNVVFLQAWFVLQSVSFSFVTSAVVHSQLLLSALMFYLRRPFCSRCRFWLRLTVNLQRNIV